jgi:hypothetical protein
MLEAYSVLTRLPAGLAVPPATAVAVLEQWFPQEPLQLPKRQRRELPGALADAGVVGGAAYDGLIALEARANDEALLTLDRRAQATYRRLGAGFRALVR